MGNIKQINTKNQTYYLHNDMNNIKDFDLSLIKIDKKSYKDIKSINDCENINSVSPLYLVIGEVDGYIEENNGNKYLIFASTNKNKKVLEKYSKLWDEIKYHIQTINAGILGANKKDYMKMKFNSDDDLSLNKQLKLMLTIIVRSIFEEDGKCYPQVLLDDCLYKV